MPKETNKKFEVIQWLMLQVGGVGPMRGQTNVWFRYMDVSYQPAIDRYQREVKRLLGILDQRLGEREFLVDEFGIADIAHWAWVRTHFWSAVEIDDLPNLSAWVERFARRPGCQRGVDCQPLEVSAPADKSKFIKNARSMLISKIVTVQYF
jgi:GST-like protein